MQQGYQLFEGDRRVQTRMIDLIFKHRRRWDRVQLTGTETQREKKPNRWATEEMVGWAISVSNREDPRAYAGKSYKERIEVSKTPTDAAKQWVEDNIRDAAVPGPVPAVK